MTGSEALGCQMRSFSCTLKTLKAKPHAVSLFGRHFLALEPAGEEETAKEMLNEMLSEGLVFL
jgi:hypothetical protein